MQEYNYADQHIDLGSGIAEMHAGIPRNNRRVYKWYTEEINLSILRRWLKTYLTGRIAFEIQNKKGIKLCELLFYHGNRCTQLT